MKLMDLGIIANVNQSIDYETASIVADESALPPKEKGGHGGRHFVRRQ